MSLFRPSKSKTKSAVIVGTFDGRTITDRRFEVGQWPVAFEVETPYADAWLTYFAMECEQRGWSCTNLAQLGARENSGSFTIGISGTNSATLVWERRKNKPLKIKARVEQHASLQLAELQSALSATNASCRAAQLTRVYCRGQLEYDGLPWRGELWLDDALRLGPASREYEEALIGPRVIVVDAEIEGIDQRSARERFQIRLRELAVFLSVVARLHVVPHRQPRSGWTWNLADGTPHCEVRQVGYLETSVASEMPSRSTCSPVPTREVRRPDLERRGIASADTEQWIPADLVDLWAAFRALPENERKQFLQAANLWHCAQNIGHEFQTTRFALIVASGEALKPRGKEFRELTLYHVVAGLLGQECADLLRENWGVWISS